MIEWITVFSNDIQKIGYDSTTNKLHIDFKDGTEGFILPIRVCKLSSFLLQSVY